LGRAIGISQRKASGQVVAGRPWGTIGREREGGEGGRGVSHSCRGMGAGGRVERRGRGLAGWRRLCRLEGKKERIAKVWQS
jgi:hypothetical protein